MRDNASSLQDTLYNTVSDGIVVGSPFSIAEVRSVQPHILLYCHHRNVSRNNAAIVGSILLSQYKYIVLLSVPTFNSFSTSTALLQQLSSTPASTAYFLFLYLQHTHSAGGDYRDVDLPLLQPRRSRQAGSCRTPQPHQQAPVQRRRLWL